jgi:two-component system aerobic respiration control sensor histidine kinase ArcB
VKESFNMSNSFEENYPFISLVNHTQDLVICLSGNGELILLNPVAENFLGKSKKKLLGKRFSSVCGNLNLSIFEESEVSNLLSGLPITNLETEAVNFDGSLHNISWSLLPLINAKAVPEGIILLGKDITEFKMTSLQMDRLDNIIKYAPDWIYWKDVNSVHLGANEQFAAAAGLQSRDEMIGKTDHEFPWAENADKFIADDKGVIESGEARLNIEDTVPLKNNKKAIVISNKVPLRDTQTGEVIGVLGIATDITQRKELEEDLRLEKERAEAMNRTKTEFLGNMSHDIKTPLAGIIGISELLVNETEDEETQELLEEIMECGRTLMTFFDNCLELSKLENADVTLVTENFSLKELVEQVCALFRPAIRGKELNFTLEYDEKIAEYLIGSKAAIYRILQNLLGNAIKFTSEGFVGVKISIAEQLAPDKIYVEFEVKDSGLGIPEEKQKVIFERLTRLTLSHQGVYEGSGIGLYLVDKFVKAMNGEIFLESKEGEGSIFKIVLPLNIAKSAGKVQKSICKKLPGKQTVGQKLGEAEGKTFIFKNHPKILLVEDNRMAQKMAKKALEGLGCEVDVAENGEESISFFQRKQYELVFMDIGLPDISGYEATIKIKELGVRPDTPVLALTAHAGLYEKQACLDAGIEGILNKPLLKQQAMQVIKKYIYGEDIVVEGLLNESIASLEAEDKAKKKIIDLEEGTAILGLAKADAKNMVVELLAVLVATRKELEDAYKSDNLEQLLALAHKFYGGLCYIGVPRLREAAKQLELMLKNNLEKNKELIKCYQILLDEMVAVQEESKLLDLRTKSFNG